VIESTVHVTKETWEIAKWLLGLGLALLGYNLKTTKQKVDEHDKSHISRDEFNGVVHSLRKHNEESCKTLSDRLDRIIELMSHK